MKLRNIKWRVIIDLLKAAWQVYRGQLMLNRISHSVEGLNIELFSWEHFKEQYQIPEPQDYFCDKCDRLVIDREGHVHVGSVCIGNFPGSKVYVCEYCAAGVKPGSDEALVILGHR